VKLSYNKWAIEDDRADDVTVIVAYVNSTNDVDMLTHGADVYDEGDESSDDDDDDDDYLSSSSSLDDEYDNDRQMTRSSSYIRERLQSVNIYGNERNHNDTTS
jgi:hypothetical protein